MIFKATFRERLSSPSRARAALLAGKAVTAVACGDRHSLALTRAGAVMSWGEGSVGQLGLGKGGGAG